MDPVVRFYQHPLLGPKELEKVRAEHLLVSFKKGEVILARGQQANTYYCLEKGVARSYVQNQSGQDITTGFVVSGEIIIDVVSLFTRIPAVETIVCVTDCTCHQIDYEAFQQLFHSIAGLSEWGRNWMSNALFEHRKRSIAMITEPASNRYLSLVKAYPEIIENVPLKHIATYLGITDSSLSRIRRELSRH